MVVGETGFPTTKFRAAELAELADGWLVSELAITRAIAESSASLRRDEEAPGAAASWPVVVWPAEVAGDADEFVPAVGRGTEGSRTVPLLEFTSGWRKRLGLTKFAGSELSTVGSRCSSEAAVASAVEPPDVGSREAELWAVEP